MIKIIGFDKLPNTDPQKYRLMLHDSENTKPNYVMENVDGTESVIRALLKNGGMTDGEIEVYFAR